MVPFFFYFLQAFSHQPPDFYLIFPLALYTLCLLSVLLKFIYFGEKNRIYDILQK